MDTLNIFVALVLSLALNYLYILKFSKLKHCERTEGIALYKNKKKTITMGGINFVLSSVILFFIIDRVSNFDRLIFLIFMPLVYFIIGFIDDYLIVIKKNNDGIKAFVKLLIEIIASAITFYLYLRLDLETSISFFKFSIDLKWIYGILLMFMYVGGSNAVNLTDGVDGLCAGVSIIVLMGFLYISYDMLYLDVSLYIVLLIGSLLGFLYFNLPLAKLFMGDTGSLFLGASIVSIAILLKQEILLLVFGFVFVFETVSVILQVFVYKHFNQKRLFKMAPFHHHLEIKGYSDTSIILLMYFISFLLMIFGIVLYNGGI